MEGFRTEDQEISNDGNNNQDLTFTPEGLDFIDQQQQEDEDTMDGFDFETFVPDAPANDNTPAATGNNNPNPPADTNKNIFDEEQEEEEEETNELDLAAFNKQMGTDYKTVEELKQAFNKTDNNVNVREQEEQTISRNNNHIELFEGYLRLDDKELIKLDLTAEYRRESKNVNDPDIIQEIEDKLEAIESMGDTRQRANLVKNNLSSHLEKLKNENNTLNNKWQEHDRKEGENNRKAVQDYLMDVGKSGFFYGVKITSDDLKEVYKDITTNKFQDRVNSSQQALTELALLERFRDQIQKNATRPAHSDGVKSVFDQANGKRTQQSLATARNSTSGNNDDHASFISGFVK